MSEKMLRVRRSNCHFCVKEVTVRVPKSRYNDYKRWRRGANIQDAMPWMSAGDREFLISGVCEKCFDDTCKEPEK